eukprot:scaffold79843_cov80-Phaeocystis_antarctica.AAC.4
MLKCAACAWESASRKSFLRFGRLAITELLVFMDSLAPQPQPPPSLTGARRATWMPRRIIVPPKFAGSLFIS